MTNLREKIEDILLGSRQFLGAGGHAKQIADRILEIPELKNALAGRVVGGSELEDFAPLPEHLTDPEAQRRDVGGTIRGKR